MGITIGREQRDAIYEEVLTDLSGIGDLWIAFAEGDYETARRYRRRFEDDMRLLDDLGWENEPGPAAVFELTMSAAVLGRVAGHFAARLGGSLRGQLADGVEERRYTDRALAAQAAFAALAAGAAQTDG
jgi:hypothetical protein